MNEEEFIEAESKRIKKIYLGLSLVLLVLPVVLIPMVTADSAFMFLFPLLFSGVPVLFILFSMKKKDVLGLWYSREKLSSAHLRGLSIFFVMVGAGILLGGFLFTISSDADYMALFVASLGITFFFVLSSLLSVKYIEKEMHRKLEMFEMSRSILLGIPVDSAKKLITEAIKGLEVKYSEVVPRSKFDRPWHIELETGMRIYAIKHFKNSQILIARIPKNDLIEPKIEEEILRLAALHNLE